MPHLSASRISILATLSIAVVLMSLATFVPTSAQDKSKSKAQVGGATYQRVTDPADQSAQETTKNDGTRQETKPSASPGDGYVGTEVCIACHEDQNRRFKNTPMGRAMANPHTPEESRGCESCHGPGQTHVEAGGGKDTIPVRFGKDSPNSVAEQNATCEACHGRGTHMFWKGSPHESRGMACRLPPGKARIAHQRNFRSPLQFTAHRKYRIAENTARVVPAMSPDAEGTVTTLLAHAVSGGQSDLHQLPQPAWHT